MRLRSGEWRWSIVHVIFMMVSIQSSLSKVLLFKDYRPPNMDEEGHYIFNIERGSKIPISRLHEEVDIVEEKSREKRDVSANNSTISRNITTYVLNDPLQQMIIHWVGKNSSAIVVLTKDVSVEQLATQSNVYFSYDYGKSFQKVKSIKKPISKFYHAPSDITKYIFVDIAGKSLFTTDDTGKTFQRSRCPFKPTYLSIHPTRSSYVIGYDKDISNGSLWLSRDFGETWKSIQAYAKKAYWGYSEGNSFDHLDALYVEREEPSGKISVLKSETFFQHDNRDNVLITGVEEFVIRNSSFFAVRSKGKGDNDLLVTFDRHSAFVTANFPTREPKKEFFVIDSADNQIMVLVSHGLGRTDLYISELNKVDFTFSLANVTYYNPNGIGSTQQLLIGQSSALADIHKVKGLRSVFLANTATVNAKTHQYNMSDMKTKITFDKGVIWEDVPPPRLDSNGKTICNGTSCSLHLLQDFHSAHWAYLSAQIMSEASAPGFILAAGSVGSEISTKSDVFFSMNGGKDWEEIQKGEWYYNWADHGGILAMVQRFGKTNTLIYSLDEGDTWENVTFYTEPISVYGFMTEPGETTTIFTVFGATNDIANSWIIIQVDLKWVFHGRKCHSWNYRNWSPEDENGMSCLLGTKMTYKRKYTYYGACYNGKNYDRPTSIQSCHCTRFDFECAKGFYLAPNSHSLACIRDPNSNIDPFEIPPNCRSGSSYKRTRGYAKIPGDRCMGGDADAHYGPVAATCPLIEENAFLLVTSTSGINRIDLENDRMDSIDISVSHPSRITNIDYDYKHECYYYTQGKKIKKACRDSDNAAAQIGSSQITYKTVVTESEAISVMAIDWDSRNIYWGTATPFIKVKSLDLSNDYVRKLPVNTTFLQEPTSIALHPTKGYMYYSDELKYHAGSRIVRANLDGTNATLLTHDYSARWYSSLSVDESSNRLYFISQGSYFTKIGSMELDSPHYQHSHLYDSNVRDVATFKHLVYYWRSEGDLQRADKYEIHANHTLALNLRDVGVIKVVRKGLQIYPNPCGNNTLKCPQLCIPVPGDKSSQTSDAVMNCYCDNINYVTQDDTSTCKCRAGEILTPEGQCEPNTTVCIFGHYRCHDGRCIPSSWLCDHAEDCAGGEDEKNCDYNQCKPGYKKCPYSAQCIENKYFCDGVVDCVGGGDEKECNITKCDLTTHFKCSSSVRCINSSYVCDGYYDCDDLSDETNCNTTITCSSGQFSCPTFASFHDCVPSSWVCDGGQDCLDGSDEKSCNSTCKSYQFSCGDGTCIYKQFTCDGSRDCANGNDEADCPTTLPRLTTSQPPPFRNGTKCTDSEMKCSSHEVCIPLAWKCDGSNDCGDHSDEFDCGRPSNESGLTHPCRHYLFDYKCNHGDCILAFFECDGDNDCGDWSDEKHCENFNDKANHPGCFTGIGVNYRGNRNYTKSGRTCQMWSSNTPHRPHYWPQDRNHNFCRNPDNDGFGPWCYTTDAGKRWEYCGIPRCINGSAHSGPAPTSSPRICQDGLFQCHNDSKCIHERWTCDGENDCEDGSDEKWCNSSTCNNNELRCKNGRCVLLSAQCDGVDDCLDNTDENNCHMTSPLPCNPATQFKCKESFQCISKSLVCNGVHDCYDYSDETCNITGTTIASVNFVQCIDGRGKVLSEKLCDYFPDCKDMSDEKNCANHVISARVQSNYKCPSGLTKACRQIKWSAPVAPFPDLYKSDLKYVVRYKENIGYIDILPEDFEHDVQTITASITETSAILKDLKWYTSYIVYLTVAYKNVPLPMQRTSHFEFMTPHGPPDAPTSVEARVVSTKSDVADVEVIWTSKSDDVAGFYVKFKYQDYAQPVVKWFPRYYDTPTKNSFAVKYGTADISVLATNFNYNSTWSKPYHLVIRKFGRPFVTATAVDKYSCNVSWTTTATNIAGFRVRTIVTASDASSAALDAFFGPVVPQIDTRYSYVNNTSARSLVLKKLQPQTTFKISVTYITTIGTDGPYSEEADCTPLGEKLTAPTFGIFQPVSISSINATWTPPAPDGVHYQILWNEGLEPPFKTITVVGNSTAITNLPLNSQQTFRIRIIKPYTGEYSSPMKASPMFDYKEHVRKLDVAVDPNLTGANVSWERPLDSMVIPLGYVVSLYDARTGKLKDSHTIPKTTDLFLHHHFGGLIPGRTYRVSVRTSTKGADKTNRTFLVGEAPGPIAFPAESEKSHSGRYKVPFHMDDRFKDFFNSESVKMIKVYLCNGVGVKTLKDNDCTTYPDVNISDGAIRLTIEDAGEYTLLMQPACHESQECSFTSLPIMSDGIGAGPTSSPAAVTMSQSTVLAIAIPAVVIILVLIITVIILQVRKRRLAEAYRGFVASHYDPQSGEAVFMSNDDDEGTGLGLDDDQDVETPLITGFADDEPLIVA